MQTEIFDIAASDCCTIAAQLLWHGHTAAHLKNEHKIMKQGRIHGRRCVRLSYLLNSGSAFERVCVYVRERVCVCVCV